MRLPGSGLGSIFLVFFLVQQTTESSKKQISVIPLPQILLDNGKQSKGDKKDFSYDFQYYKNGQFRIGEIIQPEAGFNLSPNSKHFDSLHSALINRRLSSSPTFIPSARSDDEDEDDGNDEDCKTCQCHYCKKGEKKKKDKQCKKCVCKKCKKGKKKKDKKKKDKKKKDKKKKKKKQETGHGWGWKQEPDPGWGWKKPQGNFPLWETVKDSLDVLFYRPNHNHGTVGWGETPKGWGHDDGKKDTEEDDISEEDSEQSDETSNSKLVPSSYTVNKDKRKRKKAAPAFNDISPKPRPSGFEIKINSFNLAITTKLPTIEPETVVAVTTATPWTTPSGFWSTTTKEIKMVPKPSKYKLKKKKQDKTPNIYSLELSPETLPTSWQASNKKRIVYKNSNVKYL